MRRSPKQSVESVIRLLTVGLTMVGLCGEVRGASVVQTVAKASSGTASTLSVSFSANTASGNLIVVGFDFDTNSTPSSITDSQGNIFAEVGNQLTSPGGARSRVYYAKNIKGGPDTITVNLSASSAWIELYISEYSGVDTANPIDAEAGAFGTAGSVSSGVATTTSSGDLIYGYCVADRACTAGAGFTVRSSFNNNLIEDMTAGAASNYAATGSANNGWSMQLVALKSASSTDTTPPTVPTNLSATAVSPTEINLTWTPSTDNVGVVGYRVFRSGTQIATTTTTSYVDINLAPSTTYSYTVAAFDAAGNVSAQSTAAMTTTSPSDTTPPSTPTNLTGSSPAANQVNLSWSPSTDNVGLAGYHVLRNGSQVGTTSSTTYVDSGLTASTTYTYTVNAFDAAGNVSAPSNPVAVTTAAGQPAYRLAISANGKYLINSATGQPVFLTGDSPQLLSLQLSSMSDVNQYIADRKARGYNAIWVTLADQTDQNGAPNDANGNPPFNGAWWVSPNATYWAHQDEVIQAASAAGMTVFAMPSFVGNNDGQPSYDTPSYLASSVATIQAYGTFLGNRYKSFDNIVWLLGGDYNPISSSGVIIKPKLEALGAAIAAADPNHLITIEGCQRCGFPLSTSPYNVTTLPEWLGLNSTDTTQANIVISCQNAFSSNPFLPPFEVEDWYELENGITGFQARQEGYWEVLSGCYAGRMFGNGPIWSFNATHSGDTTPSWQSQLGSPGSQGEQFMGQLMRSREHWLMAPDANHSVLTTGFGSGSTLSVAARSSDGQTIIAYLSDGNATAKTINMSAIASASSSTKAWWYNPQTGAATLVGTFPNSGSQSFTAPDGNDWVLVIDDASANLPAPGSANLSQNSGPQVTALTCSPISLISGGSSSCQIVLNQNAPSGGSAVALTNSNIAALTVPASVVVSAGVSSGTFAATAANVTTPQSATVTATLNGGSSVTLSVQAPILVSSLSCSPTTLNSGGLSTCTVTLNQGAPTGGASVVLTNSNTAALAVPASVTVVSGASSATFSAAAAVVTASQSATISATHGTSSQSVSLTILFVDNVPPSVSIVSPTAGQTVSGTITLSANASDNVGVAWVQFKVDGSAIGPQITATPYNYSLVTTSLANAMHTITAVASDLSGNTATSAPINITVNNPSNVIAFVQIASKAASAASSSLSLSFSSNTTAGNLILVGFDFDSNSTPSSVSDSQGNAFVEVGTQLTSPGGSRSRVYYAKSIKGGSDTITVSLTANSAWIEVYISEYSGADTASPVDAQAGASGKAGSVSSGAAITTLASDLIYGYCVADWACTAGSGFTARSVFNANLIEDMTAGAAGNYAATASANNGWTMQLVALKK